MKMMRIFSISSAAFLCLAVAASPATAQQPGKLVVHEWGTFLSVQGSDGVTLGGMVESDEVLPGFVEARGVKAWMRAMFNQKMETPVTYFYVDRPMDVNVRVEMNKGVLTHWFPFVRSFGPSLNAKPDAKTPPKSYLDWGRVKLTPSSSSKPAGVPNVPNELTWRFARETDAAMATVSYVTEEARDRKDASEKFLFYRGLGSFPLPLAIRTAEPSRGQLELVLENQADKPLAGLFAINVERGAIQFSHLEDLAGKQTRQLELNSRFSAQQSLESGIPQVKQALADTLVAAGLYPKEAQAMVNTWERSYFHTDGLRVLYILPRQSVDEVIPLKVQPTPQQVVRVMVGRVEVLTPQKEQQIERFVADLGADAFATRQAATQGLSRLGRISEPALRRVLAKTDDPEVRTRVKLLIGQMTPTP